MKKILAPIIFVLILCISVLAQSENMPCPSIAVVGPKTIIQPGETMIFSASASVEVKNHNVKYKWTVDKGTIISGQETTVIQIATEGLSDIVINAILEVEGLPKHCQNKFEEVAVIAPTIDCCCYEDEFGRINFEEVKLRLDSFLLICKQIPTLRDLF